MFLSWEGGRDMEERQNTGKDLVLVPWKKEQKLASRRRKKTEKTRIFRVSWSPQEFERKERTLSPSLYVDTMPT
jgi:hypothetical protein